MIWDFFVLFLFIFKVCQIKLNTQFKGNEIYERVNFILKKVTILTVLYEVKHVFQGIIATLLNEDVEWSLTVNSVYYGIDCIVSCILICLMIEHNNEVYIHFINILCCSKCKNGKSVGNVVVMETKEKHGQTDSIFSRQLIPVRKQSLLFRNQYKNLPTFEMINKYTECESYSNISLIICDHLLTIILFKIMVDGVIENLHDLLNDIISRFIHAYRVQSFCHKLQSMGGEFLANNGSYVFSIHSVQPLLSSFYKENLRKGRMISGLKVIRIQNG